MKTKANDQRPAIDKQSRKPLKALSPDDLAAVAGGGKMSYGTSRPW